MTYLWVTLTYKILTPTILYSVYGILATNILPSIINNQILSSGLIFSRYSLLLNTWALHVLFSYVLVLLLLSRIAK